MGAGVPGLDWGLGFRHGGWGPLYRIHTYGHGGWAPLDLYGHGGWAAHPISIGNRIQSAQSCAGIGDEPKIIIGSRRLQCSVEGLGRSCYVSSTALLFPLNRLLP